MYFTMLLGLIWLPLMVIFLLAWLFTGNKIYGYILLFHCSIPLIVWAILSMIYPSKKKMTRADIYGTYVIDRSRYAGKQADWQYDHFKFKIEEPDRFTFYVMEKDTLITFYTGKVRFSERNPQIIALDMIESSRHHIIVENPTLYRKPASFNYVFYSKKFGNVFFTKKK